MRASLTAGGLAGLLLLALLVPLTGLSPRSHAASRAMEQARRAAASGSMEAAAGFLAEAAARQPARSDLWELAGSYAFQAGQPQAAIRNLERAAQGSDLSPQGQVILGDAYLQDGRLPAAIRAWQSIPDPPPEVTERMLEAHLTLKDYPAAIADLRLLLVSRPGDAEMLYQLGLLVASQRPEAALAALDQAASLDRSLSPPVEVLRRSITTARAAGDPAYSLLNAGQALASLDEWELAAEAFRQAALLRPDYAEAWAFLGEARQHLTPDMETASAGLADLQKALELDPGSLAANTLLAVYWGRQERFDLASDAIQRAIRLEPANPALRVEAGSLLATQGDLAGAQAAYQKAVELAPYDPAYLRLLAGFCLKYDNQVRDLALPAARRAVALGSEDPANLDLMAQVLLELNDLVSARRFLQRALQAQEDFAPAHLHIGQLYLASGELLAAKKELERARSLAPGSPAAGHAQRLLQSYFP